MALFHGKQARFPYRSLEDVTPYVKRGRKENKKNRHVAKKQQSNSECRLPAMTEGGDSAPLTATLMEPGGLPLSVR